MGYILEWTLMHITQRLLFLQKKKKKATQRCSPSITEFHLNWFHADYSACWDLLLFHDQLCINKEEHTAQTCLCRNWPQEKKMHKTLFLTYAFSNFWFLLEAFLPDALDTQPLPPKRNVSKERCSVSLTWSHEIELSDVQGCYWIKGHFCCMGTRKISKDQWVLRKECSMQ